MEESLKQLQASANVNEDLENLRKELAQLKNVNIDEIPNDLDEIKRIIGSLDDEQIKAIKNSLEGMGKAADDLVPSLEKTSKELEKTGQEGKELTRVG
jgi:archaellum component FlaC